MPTSSVTTGSPASLASAASIASSSSSSSPASSSTLVVPAAGACDALLYLSQHGLPLYDRYILLDRLPYANETGNDEEDNDDERSSLYRALTKSKGRFFRVLSRLYDEATVHDADGCVVHFDRHQKIAYHYNVDIQGLLLGQHPLPERFDLFLSARSPTPTWLPSFLAPPSLASSSDAPVSPLSCRPRLFLFGHELDTASSKMLGSQHGQVEVVDLAAAVEGWEARQPRRWGNVLRDVRVMEKKEKKGEAKKMKKATSGKTARKEMEEEAGGGEGNEGRKTKKGKKEGEDVGDKKKEKEDEKEKKKDTTATATAAKEKKSKKKPAKKMPNPFVRT